MADELTTRAGEGSAAIEQRGQWNPPQYALFSSERARPFFDLLEQVHLVAPRRIVDLGCGSGSLTATLAERWPEALVLGIDSSPEMIEATRPYAIEGRCRFELDDLDVFTPPEPVDLIVANASLQWVPGHRRLLSRSASFLAPGGVLAFQVPGNFSAPSHTLLRDLRLSEAWRDLVGEGADRTIAVDEPEAYLAELIRTGFEANVWETTYYQVLAGTAPVLEWMKGTALSPVLSRLGDNERERFCAELGALLDVAYPKRPFGTVLPFRRIFAVATRMLMS